MYLFHLAGTISIKAEIEELLRLVEAFIILHSSLWPKATTFEKSQNRNNLVTLGTLIDIDILLFIIMALMPLSCTNSGRGQLWHEHL